MRCFITGAEKEGDQGKDHSFAKIGRKLEKAKHHAHGDHSKSDFERFNDFQDASELKKGHNGQQSFACLQLMQGHTHFPDVTAELVNELAREEVTPETVYTFSEADLQTDLGGFEAEDIVQHFEGIVKDG